MGIAAMLVVKHGSFEQILFTQPLHKSWLHKSWLQLAQAFEKMFDIVTLWFKHYFICIICMYI